MKPTSIQFTCSHCDAQYQKWTGRCLECGKWGTVERSAKLQISNDKISDQAIPEAKLSQLAEEGHDAATRMATSMTELDRVLGGGFVPGSFILLGGEPGIGKSTLSLQIAPLLENSIYFSGEESVAQITLRAKRMQIASQSISLSNETTVEPIIKTLREKKPQLAIIDSIQTMRSIDTEGEPGNLNQLRSCTTQLLEAAKTTGTIIVLIGHVTKEGTVAGPKTLEHLVDTVLYLEGDRYHNMRILRAVKNRFGSTDEIGMFEMDEGGLRPVENPSAHLLSERAEGSSGSVVTCLMEGSRPLLVEVQALVTKTSFGYPVRKASGFDMNRLHVLIAVLQKRAKLDLSQYDVHINIVGGIRASEPATDLAICFAIASAYNDTVLGEDLVVFGEVGLGGEIRSVRFLQKRLKECATLKMKRVITRLHKEKIPAGLQVLGVKNMDELVRKAR